MTTKEEMTQRLQACNPGDSLHVRVEPKDIMTLFGCNHTADRIVAALPTEYQPHLIGFAAKSDGYSFEPVFADGWQAKWDAQLDEYYKDKAAFIARWGCE